jgi:SAM-dependent methyltransferase
MLNPDSDRLFARYSSQPQPLTLALQRMSPALDELALKFLIWARQSERDCADIGCGDGLTAAALVARGGRVVALDPDENALQSLRRKIPPVQHRRLKTCVGRLPSVDFKAAHFAAIYVARVLHCLNVSDFEQSLRKFFRWAYPDGKLFISALTPLGAFWQPLGPEFQRRRAAGLRWPGYIEDPSQFFPQETGAATSIHLLDEFVLCRELVSAGFIIEEVKCSPLPWDREQVCCAAIARCKP